MGKLRSVDTHFWDDGYTAKLDPQEKLIFLYFLTNSLTNMLGIYEIQMRKISFDTGVELETVRKALERFQRDGKAEYYEDRLILYNFVKHQSFNTNMLKSAQKEFDQLPDLIKDRVLKIETLRKALKGFGILRKIEVEIEDELEREDEEESEIPKVDSIGNLASAIQLEEDTEKAFQKYLDYMQSDRRQIVGLTQQEELRLFLSKQPDPVEVIDRTIRNGWKRLIPTNEITTNENPKKNKSPNRYRSPAKESERNPDYEYYINE